MGDPTQSPTDFKDLLARARLGERQAIGELLDGFRDYLYRLTKHHIALANRSDDSDLVQSTLTAAIEGLPRFNGGSPGEFAKWLEAILNHKAIDLIKLKHRQGALASGSNDEAPVANSTSPSGRAARGDLVLHVLAAMTQLPDDYRKVIQLRHLDDLPYEEVCRQMGRDYGAVRQLYSRAMRKLREVLGDE